MNADTYRDSVVVYLACHSSLLQHVCCSDQRADRVMNTLFLAIVAAIAAIVEQNSLEDFDKVAEAQYHES